MVLGGVFEWVLGNSFSSVVFLSFGGFWLTFAGTLNPGFAAFSSLAAEGQAASTGLQSQAFNASFGRCFTSNASDAFSPGPGLTPTNRPHHILPIASDAR